MAHPAATARSRLARPRGTLRPRRRRARSRHRARSSIVLDPGFGFGKRLDENYPLLARFGELHALGYPLLAAVSRKSFLTHTLAARRAQLAAITGASPAPSAAAGAASIAAYPLRSPLRHLPQLAVAFRRDLATLAACVAAALAGAHLVRVHEVRPSVEALAVADAIASATAAKRYPPSVRDRQRSVTRPASATGSEAIPDRSAVIAANALKYGAEGRWMGIRAQPGTGPEAGEVLITVQDHGQGIEPEERPANFRAVLSG